jgi:hypothetical protein
VKLAGGVFLNNEGERPFFFKPSTSGLGGVLKISFFAVTLEHG